MFSISRAHWNESQTHSKSLFLSDVLFVAHFWCKAGNTFHLDAGPQRQCESISMEMLKTRGAAAIPSSCAASFKARRAWNYRTLPTPRFFLPPVHLVLSLCFSLFSILQCTTFPDEEKKSGKIWEKPGEKTEKKKNDKRKTAWIWDSAVLINIPFYHTRTLKCYWVEITRA